MVKIKEYCHELDENIIFFAGDVCDAHGEGFTKK
jgi:hypothetical protein